MNLVSKDASPMERLDAIFIHICNFKCFPAPKYGVGGLMIDVFSCYMAFGPDYFGLMLKEEMKFYLDQLLKLELLTIENHRTRTVNNATGYPVMFPEFAVISFKGMQYWHDVERRAPLSAKCFVAMAFDSKKQERIDAINVACGKFGFNAFTIDEHNEAGNPTIDAKIILAIKGSRFCIVDFTGVNAGAYMEAGYAMGRDKKVIFICEESDFASNKKHFDVNRYPFLQYSTFTDLSNKLTNSIGAYIDIEKNS